MRERVFPMSPAGFGSRVFIAATALVPLLLVVLLLYAASAPYHATLEVDAERVAVRHALYGRAWPRDAIDTDSVRVTTLRDEPALTPSWRTNGIGLPGYGEGWFRLRDGGSALVFLTGSKVVLLTARDGTRVLFSAAAAEAAADRLRDGGTGSFAIAPPAGSLLWFVLGLSALLVLPIAGLLFAIGRAMVRTDFVVSDRGLRIRGMFPGRALPRAELRLDAARVVDLDTERALRVRIRTWGAGLPGYVAGWCRLRNGEKALVQLTARRPVLYLPTTRGHSLLLSCDDAGGLLAALRGTDAERPARGPGGTGRGPLA